jgi:uncharacterized protein (DUF952 family)
VEPQVFKILTGSQWALWRELGITLGSADDRRDGFIHMSTAAQSPGTLSKHFARHSHVWLVEVMTGRMGAALRWEPSRAGMLFPHLYGALSVSMAAREWPLRKQNGEWALPPEIAP